jgi:hypothetical protein
MTAGFRTGCRAIGPVATVQRALRAAESTRLLEAFGTVARQPEN